MCNSKPLSEHSVLSYHAYRKYYSIKNSTWPTMYMYVVKTKQTKIAFTWLMYFMVIKLAVLD